MPQNKNPQDPVIICFASKEVKVENGTQYLIVTDKGGQKHKISEKRQPLWALFNNPHDGEPFLLVYETYKQAHYVADARPITDELLKRAVENVTIKLHDAQTEERNRSQAIAYAKDLYCAYRLTDLKKMFDTADQIYRFIKGVKYDDNPSQETPPTKPDIKKENRPAKRRIPRAH